MEKKQLSTHMREHPFVTWAIGAALVALALVVLWSALTYDGRYRAARIAYYLAATTLPLTVLVSAGRKDRGGKPKKELGALALLGVIALSGAFLLGVTRTADLVAERAAGAASAASAELTRDTARALIKDHEPLLMEAAAEMYIPDSDAPGADWSALSAFLAVRQGGVAPEDWAREVTDPSAWDRPDKQVSAHPDGPHSEAMARLFSLVSLSQVTRCGAEVIFEGEKRDQVAYAYLYYSPGDRFLWPPYRVCELVDEPETRVCADGDSKVRFTIDHLAPGWFYVSPVAGD